MEVLTLSKSCSKEDFWFNFCTIKDQTSINFPFDFFQYQCDCKEKLTLFSDGEFFLDGEITNLVDQFMAKKDAMFNQHLQENKCNATELKINAEIGNPENIVVFFDESDEKHIKNITLENTEYVPTLIINTTSPIFALYKNKCSEDDDLYKNFIMKNFESYLNIEVMSDKDDCDDDEAVDGAVGLLAFDDDSVNQNKADLPRLIGGGRRLMQEFRYICKWCPKEKLEQRNKGRFHELKNYRDHFRRYHSDIPMREFLTKVDRNEPKFLCKICRTKISLGNQLRHQLICRPSVPSEPEDSSSSSEEEKPKKKATPKKSTSKVNIGKPSTSRDTPSSRTVRQSDMEDDDDDDGDDQDGHGAHRHTKKRPITSSESDKSELESKNPAKSGQDDNEISSSVSGNTECTEPGETDD